MPVAAARAGKTGTAALRKRRRSRRKGSQCPRSGTGSGRAGQCTCRGLGDRPVMYPPYTCAGDVPGSLPRPRSVRLCCSRSEVPGRLAQIRRDESEDVPVCNVRTTGPPWTKAEVKVSWLSTGTPWQLD